jgi:hypothetical protein
MSIAQARQEGAHGVEAAFQHKAQHSAETGLAV